jgi:hypothetical protein
MQPTPLIAIVVAACRSQPVGTRARRRLAGKIGLGSLVATFGAGTFLAVASAPAATVTWRGLGTGVEYAAIAISPQPTIGDGRLHVVRIDPGKASLRPRFAAQLDGRSRTAREWCSEHGVVAAINAGMYDRDGSTHTGYLRTGDRTLSARWPASYQSILLLGPRRSNLPAATIRDARAGAGPAEFEDYSTVIQNLRLIRGPGVNVWPQSARRWSEAAIAEDRDGRILFLFSRSPFTMHDFNAMLLGHSLGIVRAMHAEGGPEASLSVHGPGIDLDLAGSYETGFNESDANPVQWRLPNVLTVEVTSRE